MVITVLFVAIFNVALGYGLAFVLHSPGALLAWEAGFELPFGLRLPAFLRAHEPDSLAPAPPKTTDSPTETVNKVSVGDPPKQSEAIERVAGADRSQLEQATGVAAHGLIDPVVAEPNEPRQSPADGATPVESVAEAEPALLQQVRGLLAETARVSANSAEPPIGIGQTQNDMFDLGGRAAAPPSARADDANLRRSVNESIDGWRATNDSRQFAIAIVDPDGLKKLNFKLGEEPVDQALKVLERIIAGGLDANQVASRSTGQTYLLALPELSSRDGVAVVERIRQQVSATEFQLGTETFRLSLSGAVVSANRDEPAEKSFERLVKALDEAKRHGGDRAFFQDGPHIAPVVPPILAIEPELVHL